MTSRNRQGVAHEWTRAQDTDHGKTGTGNLFYRGRTIYSYGTHFPIAKWGVLTLPAPPTDITPYTTRNPRVVLYNGTRRSSTTSGHQCAVRRAIPGNWYVFDVPNVDFDWADNPEKHRTNWQSIVDAHQSELEKSVKARQNKASHLSNAETLRLRANSYRLLFGLIDVADIPQNPDIQASIEAARAQRAKYERLNEAKRVARQADTLAKWVTGDIVAFSGYFDGEVKLRISRDGRNIETSKGASFPVRHALRAYPIFLAARETMAETVGQWHYYPQAGGIDGKQLTLGHYAVDRITDRGIVAGCHVVSWAEIERIYPLALAASASVPQGESVDDYPEITAVGSYDVLRGDVAARS